MCDIEVDRAIYLSEWYSRWRHNDILDLTVAIYQHNCNSFSPAWQYSQLLYSDDLNIVLSNLQAYAARDYNTDMILGATMDIKELIRVLVSGDGSNLIGSALENNRHVAVVFVEGMHFRSLLLFPSEKCMYIFDSLGICSPDVDLLRTILRGVANKKGWHVTDIGEGQQQDGWNCGLWATLSILLTQRYMNKKSNCACGLMNYILGCMGSQQKMYHSFLTHLFNAITDCVQMSLPVNAKVRCDDYEGAGLVGDSLQRSHILNLESRPARVSLTDDGIDSHGFEPPGGPSNEVWQLTKKPVKISNRESHCVQMEMPNRFDCLKDLSMTDGVSQNAESVSGCDAAESQSQMFDRPLRSHVTEPVKQGERNNRNSNRKFATEALLPIFADVVEKLGSANMQAAKITYACLEDERCTFNKDQVYRAWQKCKSRFENAPKISAFLFEIFKDLPESLCQERAALVLACKSEMRSKGYTVTDRVIINAWYRFKSKHLAACQAKPESKFSKAEKLDKVQPGIAPLSDTGIDVDVMQIPDIVCESSQNVELKSSADDIQRLSPDNLSAVKIPHARSKAILFEIFEDHLLLRFLDAQEKGKG